MPPAGDGMDELGSPVAYTAVNKGTPVYDRDGERIGEVAHVVADEPVDVFHGLIVQTGPPPRRHRYAPADQIAAMRERGVRLSVAAAQLHRIDDDPAARTVDEGLDEHPPQPGLRRSWHWGDGR